MVEAEVRVAGTGMWMGDGGRSAPSRLRRENSRV